MGFSRNERKFKQEKLRLIVCEDERSGKDYLNQARIFYRANTQIKVVNMGRSDPLQIVDFALGKVNDYEEIYCVIDRDTHENFDEAVNKSKKSNKINLIVSYPCFEFWLRLHCGYSRKQYSPTAKKSPADQMIDSLRKFKIFENYQKDNCQNLFEDIYKHLADARKFAKKIREQSKEDGLIDPSTDLHLIIDLFEKLSKPIET